MRDESKHIGGRLVQGFCGCGRPAALKGTDEQGRRHYRARCNKCIRIARKMKEDRCSWCDEKHEDRRYLHTDHIDGNPSNNDPSNIQTLCIPCHLKKTIIAKDWRGKNGN